MKTSNLFQALTRSLEEQAFKVIKEWLEERKKKKKETILVFNDQSTLMSFYPDYTMHRIRIKREGGQMNFTTSTPSGDIVMDFCCELMDKHLSKDYMTFLLTQFNGRTGVYLRLGAGSVERIPYCPFCGEKCNITNDPYDELIKKGKPIRPPEWDDEI